MNAVISIFCRLMVAGWFGLVAASAVAAVAPAPLVSVSLRGVRDGRVEPGEPVSIAVRLALPARSSAVVAIAPDRGAWTDAVSVELVRDVEDRPLARGAWVGRPATAPITLDAKHAAGGLWLIPSGAMQAIAPGDYRIRAQLTVESGPAWRGRVVSAPLRLTVVPKSADPIRVSQRTAALAFEAAAGDRAEVAAKILDAQLKVTPNDRALLLLRAALSEQAGNVTAALQLANQASRGTSPKGPPPADLHDLRTRLQSRLLAPATAGEVVAPPAWSNAPAFLLPDPAKVAIAAAKPAPIPSAAGASVPASTVPRESGPAGSVPAPASVSAAPPVAPTTAGRVGAPSPGEVVPTAELKEAAIRADGAGQWAASARAKSSYSNPNYGPAKATGAPDVGVAGDSVDAWCPGSQSAGIDWLEVTFAKPVRAAEVRVRQNHNPGAIVKVEAFSPDETSHVWWEGRDPFVAPAVRDIAWFAVRAPPTPYLVARVRISLNLAAVPGWKQIDAVQLVAAP